MKRSRFAILVALVVCSGIPISAAETSHFLVLAPGSNFVSTVKELERSGAHLKQSIPPYFVELELPQGKTFHLANIESDFTDVVPTSVAQGKGPLALAAVMQWNRSLAKTAHAMGASSFGTMSAKVARENLVAPTGLTASPAADALHCSWDAVATTLLYEIEAADDPQFNHVVARTMTDRRDVALAIDSLPSQQIFVHVRARDRADAEHADSDVKGSWSPGIVVSLPTHPPVVQSDPPVPTSPVDNFETVGFTVLLEWMNAANSSTRIQVARDGEFKDVIFDQVSTEGEAAVPSTALHVGDSLHWRIQSWGNRRSPWSPTRHIKIGAPRPGVTDVMVNPEAPR